MTETTAAPTAEVLASLVALRRREDWGETCPAWMEAAERMCGRPRTEGFLCRRHHQAALRRYDMERVREEAAQEKAERGRAAALPNWIAELKRIEATMRRWDPPAPTSDLAAYGGAVHPSIARRQQSRWSDSRVQKMAALVTRAQELRRRTGPDLPG